MNGLRRSSEDGILLFLALFALLLPQVSKDVSGRRTAKASTMKPLLARLKQTAAGFDLTPKQA